MLVDLDMLPWLPLKHYDQLKHGAYRVQVFLDKVYTGEPFITTRGVAILNKRWLETLKVELLGNKYTTKIQSNIGILKYPDDFLKTPEFGGRGKGAGTASEDRYLTMFKRHLAETQERLKTNSIKINMSGDVIECARIDSTPQTGRRQPKSDFTIYNLEDKAVGWISHKSGTTGKDFQQYGGVTDNIYIMNAEVQGFATDIRNMFPSGLGSGQSFYRKLTNPNTIGTVVYGLDYGKARNGPENVNEFHQGIMKLRRLRSGVYYITSSHVGHNGDIPKNSWAPMLVARYTTNAKYLNIPNARVGVFPWGKVSGKASEI